jgi:hypothetical protein
MAATLTANGITFSDGTSSVSRDNFFAPSGSVSLFYRATAPTGWTQVTTHNDKLLRIVSGTGGGSGGTNAFTTALASRPVSANVPVTINGITISGTTLGTGEIPSHSHPSNDGGTIGGQPGGTANPSPLATSTGATGNNGAHAHPAGSYTANGPWSTSVDMRIQYIDIILCSWGG